MAAAGAPRRRHPLRSASAVARNCTATPSLSVTVSLLTFHSKGASKSAAKLVWRWVTLALGHSRSRRCALHTASGTSSPMDEERHLVAHVAACSTSFCFFPPSGPPLMEY